MLLGAENKTRNVRYAIGRAAMRKLYDIRVRAAMRKIRHSAIPSGRAANKRATRVTCCDTTP